MWWTKWFRRKPRVEPLPDDWDRALTQYERDYLLILRGVGASPEVMDIAQRTFYEQAKKRESGN